MRVNQSKFRVSSVHWPRREFNPGSAKDLAEYKYFLEKGRWKERCPFIIEWPYLDIVKCIEDKVVKYHIGHLISKSK